MTSPFLMSLFAPNIRFPASGNLDFGYAPYTEWEAPSLVRGDERVEHMVYKGVAGPGKQLGKIIDAVLEIAEQAKAEGPAIHELRQLQDDVGHVKGLVSGRDEQEARAFLDRLADKDRVRLRRLLDDYGKTAAQD